MAKTIKITLAGAEYEVPRLTVGQAEDLAEFWERTDAQGHPVDQDGAPLKGKALLTHTIDIATVALRRASPAIGNLRDLDCEVIDLQAAVAKVFEFGRLTREGDDAGKAMAGEAPASPAA